MDAPINHETLAHVLATCGLHGYWPYSDQQSTITVNCTNDQGVDLRLEFNLENPQLIVHLNGCMQAVYSVFDNGSGPKFRYLGNDPKSEFISFDNQSGTIEVRVPGHHRAVFKTPLGHSIDAYQRRIDDLQSQIPVLDYI